MRNADPSRVDEDIQALLAADDIVANLAKIRIAGHIAGSVRNALRQLHDLTLRPGESENKCTGLLQSDGQSRANPPGAAGDNGNLAVERKQAGEELAHRRSNPYPVMMISQSLRSSGLSIWNILCGSMI